MTRLAAALALSLASGVAACASPAPPRDVSSAPAAVSGASRGTVLRRATLLTHDIEASMAFYEIIGFEKWYVGQPGTIAEDGLPVEGTRPGDSSRFVIMKGHHPYVGMIGLLQYGEATEAGPPGLRHGDAIMMVETERLADKFARLVAAGHTVHKPVEKTRVASVDAEWDALFAMVYDPDGHLVELTERLD